MLPKFFSQVCTHPPIPSLSPFLLGKSSVCVHMHVCVGVHACAHKVRRAHWTFGIFGDRGCVSPFFDHYSRQRGVKDPRSSRCFPDFLIQSSGKKKGMPGLRAESGSKSYLRVTL